MLMSMAIKVLSEYLLINDFVIVYSVGFYYFKKEKKYGHKPCFKAWSSWRQLRQHLPLPHIGIKISNSYEC